VGGGGESIDGRIHTTQCWKIESRGVFGEARVRDRGRGRRRKKERSVEKAGVGVCGVEHLVEGAVIPRSLALGSAGENARSREDKVGDAGGGTRGRREGECFNLACKFGDINGGRKGGRGGRRVGGGR